MKLSLFKKIQNPIKSTELGFLKKKQFFSQLSREQMLRQWLVYN